MPNWCDCKLRITGPNKDREAFIVKAAETNWPNDNEDPEKPISECTTEEVIDKVAEALTIEDEKTCLSFTAFNAPPKGAGNDWCTMNWGTKWDASDPVMNHNVARTVYEFATAWSPPFGALATMSKQHPTLTFDLRYWEGGMGFSGRTVIKNNEATVNSYNDGYRGMKGG